MEALGSLEDKWKLSTQKALALFACTSFLLIGVCVAALALRRRQSKSSGSIHQEPCKDSLNGMALAEPPAWTGRCSVVMKALIGTVRWSSRSKWEESLRGSQREAPTPLLVKREHVGWQSHNSTSAVWQRPILMGEKCELPRFSGLILYDHRGMPLHLCEEGDIHIQEMASPVVRTTLRDLL